MDKKAEQPMQMEKKIGNTTYIVTSHFPSEGSTAVDKIKRLIDMGYQSNKIRAKKFDFLTVSLEFGIILLT